MIDNWQKLLDGEREELRSHLRDEGFEMNATVVRHYRHGRIELHQGNSWWVYVETDQGIEFLDTAATLKQAEELYYSWWEA